MPDDATTLDAAAVRRLLTPPAARESQRTAFLALHRGTGTAPPRAVLPGGGGYSFCYAARHAPGAGAVVKLGSFVPGNPARGLPAVSATVLVLDPVDGRVRATLDGEELTTLRTAAASALAVEALAPWLRDAPVSAAPVSAAPVSAAPVSAAPVSAARAPRVAVLGSGVQGRAHVDAVLDVLPGAEVVLWGRTAASVGAWADALRRERPGTPVRIAPTPARAVGGADVVLCCTSASDPLFALDDLAPRATVVSVGSVAPDRREVPAALVETAALVVDSPADALAGCGPVVDAVARGALDPATLTGLGAVLDGAAPSGPGGGRALHLSVGIGLQDAAAAWAVVVAHDAERAASPRHPGPPRRGPRETPARRGPPPYALATGGAPAPPRRRGAPMKRSVTTTVAGALAAGVLAVTALPADAASLGSSEVVANWYQDFLGRNLASARNDPGHLVWSDRLDAGDPRGQVLADVTRSPEYARTNVTALYAVLLGRPLDPGASYWLENVPRGMAVEWVEQNVLASPEFRSGLGDAETVEQLYAYVLGREPRPGETAYWVGQLRTTLGRDHLRLVRAVWYTDEAADLRVTVQYERLLGRTPDAGEVAYWRGSEKQSDLATSIAFASSPEYFPLEPAAADAAALAAGTTRAQADAEH